MPKLVNPPLSSEISSKIIEEAGARKIANACSITVGGVYIWKLRGIPKYRADFLRLKFPKLEAWKLLKQ